MKLARPHLDVVLVTADLDEAVSFWCEVAGLDLERRSADDAVLRAGDQCVRLVAPRPTPPRAPGGLYEGTGYRVLALLVDDLDAVCDRILASGRRVAPGIDLPGSWPVRFARDADGNMLELIGRPQGSPRTRLDRLQVGLTVADARRMRGFYGEALGLPEQPPRPMGDGMTRYAFAVGDSTLKLWSRPEPLPRLSGPPGLRRGIRAVTLAVASLERARTELASRGVAPVEDPGIPCRAGGFWIEDPEGGWIEIREDRAVRPALSPRP